MLSRKCTSLLRVALLLAIVAALTTPALLSSAQAQYQPNDNLRMPRYFDETGFWVQGPKGDRAFVLPGYGELRAPAKGERVAIDGVVFHMPDEMRRRLGGGSTDGPPVYVYAWGITPTGDSK